jgi:trimeric autotransporter adhesin
VGKIFSFPRYETWSLGQYMGMKTLGQFVKENSLIRAVSPLRVGCQVLLLLSTGLAAVVITPVASAQTCQDGCFYSNTYQGSDAMLNFGSGGNNTAFGAYALMSMNGGQDNTAIGAYAMDLLTTGSENTAVGVSALYSNTVGANNTAVGVDALVSNVDGNDNSATGVFTLYSNTSGVENTATGDYALYSNVIGVNNTATGGSALYYNTASNNTATGYHALYNNTTGSSNLAEGNLALSNNTIGSNNIAVGDSAGINLTTGKNNIDIGNKGVAGESNSIRLGKNGTQTATFIAGISGTTVSGGVGVIIGSNGKLGTINSSARYKDAIKPMDKASEALFSLHPVTFRYKHELDPEGILQFGLVAEEVEKVNPDLVARDEEGKPYTVRYEAVNAMLLNEFIKDHRRATDQETRISQLTSADANHEAVIAAQEEEIAALKQSLNEQASEIEKASDELTMLRKIKTL